MATTIKAFASRAASWVALAGLASCHPGGSKNGAGDAKGGAGGAVAQAGQLFPDNFKGVCSGASVAAATAYDAKAAAHKALYFETYKDDFSDRSSSLPGDWTVQYSPNGDPFKAIDLVACARRTAAQEVKICDKYKTNGSETRNKVRWHTATYELSVFEAKTGKKLGTTTLQATDAECPMFENFSGTSDTIDDYASPSDSAVADVLRPYMTH